MPLNSNTGGCIYKSIKIHKLIKIQEKQNWYKDHIVIVWSDY